MGSRVDKSPNFHRNKQVFLAWHYLWMIPCRVQKFVWKLRKFSRDAEKKLARVFLCIGRKHMLIFCFNERSEFFVFSHHFWVSLEIALSFFRLNGLNRTAEKRLHFRDLSVADNDVAWFSQYEIHQISNHYFSQCRGKRESAKLSSRDPRVIFKKKILILCVTHWQILGFCRDKNL